MKLSTQLVFIGIAITSGLLYNQYRKFVAPAQVPHFDVNTYWGPGDVDVHKDNNESTLVEIRYRDKPIDELRTLLNTTLILPPPLEGVASEYGVNSEFLAEFVAYWRDDYLKRWHSREVYFNRLPHYTTYIQGLKIHYIHTKATYDVGNKIVIPILLLHGFPGSFREFYEFTTLLASPETKNFDVVFEVVVPSYPGYGYSDAAAKPGLGAAEIAVIMRNLMLRLNYDRFYIQGGDWGYVVGSAIATIFPENVIGFHSNFCSNLSPLSMVKDWIASFSPKSFLSDPKYESFHYPKSEKFLHLIAESGYFYIQATKPDTIGIALVQNPIGLAAYLVEKFSTWTNPSNIALKDGGWSTFDEEFQDAILDNIMVYYLTYTMTSSMRIYSETYTFRHMAHNLDMVPTHVPVGCARFKHDILHSLDWQLIDKYPNLVHSTYHSSGGHMIALEKPNLLFKDFVKFVKIVQMM